MLLRKKLSLILLVAAVVISGMLVAGCTDQTAQEATSKGTVSIGYVLWDSEIASSNVLKQVFEKAGYDVELIAVDAGPLYQALADGDVDCTISAWLPGTQASYWEKYGDDIDLVRHNLDGAKCGLVVPDYVTIDSIDEMNGVKDKFDKRITGIESGAGMMGITEKVIKSYDLDYELLPSSSAAMAAELSKAYNENEWIVVTGWTPHWMFVRFNLKYLDDPKGFYGEEEYIGTLANPECMRFLSASTGTQMTSNRSCSLLRVGLLKKMQPVNGLNHILIWSWHGLEINPFFINRA